MQGRKHIPWIPSPLKAVAMALALVDASRDDRLVDIGCGDGRVAIIAAKHLRTISTCVEIDETLCVLAEANAIFNGISDRFEVICDDAFQINYKDYDIVYLYMYSSFNEAMGKKLDRELKKGARIVTLDFPMPGWVPIVYRRLLDEKSVLRTVYLYIVGISNPSSWRISRFEGYPEKHRRHRD